MSLFNNPKWLNEFEYNYKTVDEVPQSVFDSINADLDKITGDNPLVTVLIAAWNEEINILRCIGSLSKTKCNFPIEIIETRIIRKLSMGPITRSINDFLSAPLAIPFTRLKRKEARSREITRFNNRMKRMVAKTNT